MKCKCPNCGKIYTVSSSKTGKKATCKKCSQRFTIGPLTAEEIKHIKKNRPVMAKDKAFASMIILTVFGCLGGLFLGSIIIMPKQTDFRTLENEFKKQEFEYKKQIKTLSQNYNDLKKEFNDSQSFYDNQLQQSLLGEFKGAQLITKLQQQNKTMQFFIQKHLNSKRFCLPDVEIDRFKFSDNKLLGFDGQRTKILGRFENLKMAAFHSINVTLTFFEVGTNAELCSDRITLNDVYANSSCMFETSVPGDLMPSSDTIPAFYFKAAVDSVRKDLSYLPY